jgi:hypothetical protein
MFQAQQALEDGNPCWFSEPQYQSYRWVCDRPQSETLSKSRFWEKVKRPERFLAVRERLGRMAVLV